MLTDKDKDALLNKIAAAGDWTADDANQLRAILENPDGFGVRFFRALFHDPMQALKDTFINLPLFNEMEIRAANQRQGQYRGMAIAVNYALDMTQPEFSNVP